MNNRFQLSPDLIATSRVRKQLAGGHKVLEFASESDTARLCNLTAEYFNCQYGSVMGAQISLSPGRNQYPSEYWYSPDITVAHQDGRVWRGDLVLDADNQPFGISCICFAMHLYGEGQPILVPLLRPSYRFWTEKGSEYRAYRIGASPIMMSSRVKYNNQQGDPCPLFAQLFFTEEDNMLKIQYKVAGGRTQLSLIPSKGLTVIEYSRLHLEGEPLALATWSEGTTTMPDLHNVKKLLFHPGHAVTEVEVIPPLDLESESEQHAA